MIIFQSYELAKALYENPWYKMNPKLKTIYLFMIAKSQNAPLVKGGKLIIINMATFQKVNITKITKIILLIFLKINFKFSGI